MASGKSTNRLFQRLDRSSLQRTGMAGGGEVFKGDLASEALDAVGARAMTFDKSIIVSDDFNASNPEDQALYAHEKHHLEHSGGKGGTVIRDAEEIEARAVERMVLQQTRSTEASGSTAMPQSHASGASASLGMNNSPDGAGAIYANLRASGQSHVDIVDQLARYVVGDLDERASLGHARQGDLKPKL